MTKAERTGKKNITRYLGSYSQRAKWYFNFMCDGNFPREQLIQSCRNFSRHTIEYDVEKDEYVRKFNKQWAIIAYRFAKKIHRMK